MKIAMIGHKRIPGREGGVEVVVEELSTRMVKKGHKVTAYNRRKKGLSQSDNFKGVRIIDVPTIEKKSTDAVVYAFFASIRAIFGRYDVIHYHAIGPSFFLIIPHIFGIRTVVTVHGLNYKTPKWKGFGAKFMKWGEIITAKYADEIIALSREQGQYFKDKYNRDTHYIPNGTIIHELQEPDIIKNKYGLEKGKYILFLSRVVPGKGIEYLLDAYKRINSDLKLVIAGSSEYVDDFRDMIERKVNNDRRAILTGYVSGKELEELYSNAYLFVFPSEAEGMPICLLEALSYNTPCLISDIDENLEVAQDYAVTFKSKDSEDLREKLESCINGNGRIMKNSREYIESKYSWDKIVDQTITVYEK